MYMYRCLFAPYISSRNQWNGYTKYMHNSGKTFKHKSEIVVTMRSNKCKKIAVRNSTTYYVSTNKYAKAMREKNLKVETHE